jgi:radical SAM superfamily enzyme YgiQ (UPF0313 family)
MDGVYELPYARAPHPVLWRRENPGLGDDPHSVTIMRGCFGGCSFCSITEHEGRIIQSRSEGSILQEIETIRDKDEGLHRHHLRHRRADRQHVSHGLQGRRPRPSAAGRPASSRHLQEPEHQPRRADPALSQGARHSGREEGDGRLGRALRSGGREPGLYVKELVEHHVGGYLKIAPEHTEDGPLSKMMKPGIGAYDRFKQLFDRRRRRPARNTSSSPISSPPTPAPPTRT